ncbi:MAG: AAA family ATPase [Candidatus Bathyarchaeota archaeon]
MPVFKDKNKLSPRYIPSVLPHREKQLDLLHSLFYDALENISDSYCRICQVIGGVGTGKTCTTIRFGEKLEEEAKKRRIDLKHVYLNLKMLGGSRVVLYRTLIEKVAPELYSTSLSAEEMLRELVKYLQTNKKYLLISLDEIDYFIKRTKERIVYDLTRLDEISLEKPSGVIGLVFIAWDKSFHKLLDNSELSTLGRTYVEFPPYQSSQIVNILEARVEEAFKLGVVSDEVLEYIADVTASPPVSGDIRYALDLLLYTGNLADNQGSQKILPEHVRMVHGKTFHGITDDDILELHNKGKVVLLSIVRSLKSMKEPYVSLRDIRENCAVVCEEIGIKKMIDIEEYVQDLSDRGIIDIKSLTQIGISGVTMSDLERFLDNIVEKIKSGLK